MRPERLSSDFTCIRGDDWCQWGCSILVFSESESEECSVALPSTGASASQALAERH